MRVFLLTAVAAATFCQAETVVAQDAAAGTQAPVLDVQAGAADAAAPALTSQDPSLVWPAPPVQSLQQALVQTYMTSPTLMAQRAALRRVDSGSALARAEGRPRITTGASFSQEVFRTRKVGTLGRDFSATAEVEQVLFAGGRIRNSVQAADTLVISGRADLRAVEGEVLTEAVTAFADLMRDLHVRSYTLDQVRVLETNLDSARARFRIGDVTKADVAQSEARLALAQSSLAVAEGRVQSSEENFERVVGARAGMLEPLPPLPPMPSTADEAAEIALNDNADVTSFVARARAARYEVAAAKAERLPTVSAVGVTLYSNALGTADRSQGVPNGTLPNSTTNIAAGLSLRLPLYQGGAASARVRQAEEARTVLVEQSIAAERLAVASARAAFATWRSALTAIAANESAVSANEVALTSVKIEQAIGARSILDVLNAEQELLGSRIALATASRDAYVAAFTLLNTMGAAEAADLGLELDRLYDPRTNYRSYGRAWSDWADGRRHPPASTRTVPENVNSPLTRLNANTPTQSEKHPE